MTRGAPGSVAAALIALVVMTLQGCATTGAPQGPLPWRDRAAGPLHHERTELLEAARAKLGAPYRYGGAGPRGFDCSGLVYYTHRRIGLQVPRTTRAQWRQGDPVAIGRLLPGDLLFFDLGTLKTRHVGIYEGGGTFIHAPSSGKRISRASLGNPYWRSHLIGARSYLDGG